MSPRNKVSLAAIVVLLGGAAGAYWQYPDSADMIDVNQPAPLPMPQSEMGQRASRVYQRANATAPSLKTSTAEATVLPADRLKEEAGDDAARVRREALAAFRAKDFEGARGVLHQRCRNQPEDLATCRLLGEIDLALGDASKALHWAENLLAIRSTDPDALTLYTNAIIELAKQDREILKDRMAGLRNAHDELGQPAPLRLAMAKLELEAGDLRSAIESFEEVARHDDLLVEGVLGLFRAYQMKDRKEEAVARLEAASRRIEASDIKDRPSGWEDIYANLAAAYVEAGRFEEARALSTVAQRDLGGGSEFSWVEAMIDHQASGPDQSSRR